MSKLIKTEADYENALSRVDSLFLCERSQEETDELELLIHLIEKYEDEFYQMDLPSPIDAIKFRMEQLGLKQKDVVSYFGSKSKVSEVLSGKRPLSMAMIRALNAGLKIPYEVLHQEPKAELPNDFVDIDSRSDIKVSAEI